MKPYQEGRVSLFKATVVVCMRACGLGSRLQNAAADVGGKGLSRRHGAVKMPATLM